MAAITTDYQTATGAPATTQAAKKSTTSHKMSTKNPNAIALGSMGRGIPKTMSPKAIRQRKAAAKKSVTARANRKKVAK